MAALVRSQRAHLVPANTSLQRTRRQSLRSFLLAAELDIVRPTNRMHRVLVLLAASLLGFACAKRRSEAIEPSALPPSLAPLPGALNVSAHRQVDTSVWVRYEVRVSYPAEHVVASLSKRLVGLGWSPQESNSVESALLAAPSISWQHFLDTTHKPSGNVDQLVLPWRDPALNVTLYELRFVSPSQARSEVLRISGTLLPAPLAKAWASQARAGPPH